MLQEKRGASTGYFVDNLFSSIPDIIESPVIKIVFLDHLRILSSLLGVIRGSGFEGDETVVSISLSEVLGSTFFLELGF